MSGANLNVSYVVGKCCQCVLLLDFVVFAAVVNGDHERRCQGMKREGRLF